MPEVAVDFAAKRALVLSLRSCGGNLAFSVAVEEDSMWGRAPCGGCDWMPVQGWGHGFRRDFSLCWGGGMPDQSTPWKSASSGAGSGGGRVVVYWELRGD